MVEISYDFTNLNPGRIPQFTRCPIQALLVAAVEHDCASSLGERSCAGAAQAFARRANDRFPAGDS